ncbi:protein CC2D2B isoform X3 [Monodelphis domestica]|uniref:protein CC2D2B isoform X3 n=1 Tax=Monodelphis domestica TaxID=13616 RepID=UPI0024E1CC6E|nr:protein CC2D2B isoform X3 [Monodelphis domestica]
MDHCQKREELSDDTVKKMKPQERFIMKKISKRREDMKKKISEETEHIADDETADQNLLKELGAGEKQNIIEALRGKVREKLKNAKTVQVEKSSTKEAIDTKLQQRTKKLINDSYEKHAALNNLQNHMDMDDEKIMEEVIFPDLLELKSPEYEDDQVRFEKEQEYIFVPSSSPVIHRDKLPKNMMPRILEDEGFYIKKKPETYKRTCNKMENRLLILEEGKCWFEESGEIISLPSPIKQSWNFRKLITIETLNSGLKTIYKKAIKSDVESCSRSKIEGQREMYQLDLNISVLQFSHHPLFNQEQVLCSRLLQLYECFQNRQQQNVPHLLYEKLKALTKVARDNMKINQLTKKSLQDYNWQISNTKQLYDLEQKKDISLLHNMLKTWKQIKVLRQQQGFTSTPIRLQFQKLNINIIDEKEQEEITKVSETETEFQGEDSKNGEKQESLSYLTSEFEETEFEGIQQPTLIPQLSLTTEVTNLYKCSENEQRRRARIQKLKYFIKIFYNDKQVSCTSASPLQLDFKVIFQQIFNIKLINWPETIRLEVYEISKRTSILAKIYLPVPSNTALKSKAVLEQSEFSCDKLVVPECGEVGSNVPFLLDGTGKEELCLLTSGKLSYSLSWALDENGIPLTPMSQSLSSVCHSVLRNVDARGVPGIPWLINTQKLFEWANEVRIDPNDPDYSDLMEFIMYTRHKGQTIPKYFRLEQLQEEFNFVSEEEIKKSKRFQLLQLRNAGQLDVYILQQMPLYDREIPDLVFQEYESQLEKDIQISDVNSITSQRIHSINFMKKMRKLVMKKIIKVNKFNLSDVVTDYEEIVSASQLKHAICKLVERRRNLKPRRRERKKVAAQTISAGDIHLLVRILRAYNIPSRKPVVSRTLDIPTYLLSSISRVRHKESSKSVATVEILNEDAVRPFVEVSFQHTVYQTDTANGSHPCWNEEIIVDFTSPGHDYSFSNLSKIKDNIYVNIFDETVIEKHEDHCLKGCSGHSYIRKNWLGSVIFPFSALLQQPKISGTFQVNIPPLLLGYTWSKTYVSPKEDYNGQNLKECTFLNIFATIEPQISSVISNPESDKFTDELDITLLQRAQIFRKNCEAMFPNRRIITTVFNDEGTSILVTRYIRALNPPKQLLDLFLSDSNATLDIIARFVSLIPCLPDTINEDDGFNIWMSPERCINLTIGNKEEHAILLCNYFLYFGKKAWVLLGTSTLEGQVAYVLTQETDEHLLWNPLTGQSYKQFDPFCPLQSADCLFDNENVWFNIQQNSTPMSINFDNSRESSWKQLLPKNVQIQWMKSEAAQPKEILYFETNKSMVEDLKNRIERTLKCKLMEWRPKQPTRWNRQCTAILRQILPKLELGTGSLVSTEEESEFERLLQFYWVSGFPIQLPYTDLQSIINAVYQTGIHSSEFPQTEFALAVYIHAYPNNILSIWIYLASLVRHQ